MQRQQAFVPVWPTRASSRRPRGTVLPGSAARAAALLFDEEAVHRPRHTYEVKAFTPVRIATLLQVADPETALIVRTLASTGLRFGELAGHTSCRFGGAAGLD